MSDFQYKTWKAFPFIFLIYASPSLAAPLVFDCDVPPNHYSSISEDLTGPASITGTIEALELRSGKNLPVAGARLISPDGLNSVGLQLVADSPQANKFDIVLNTRHGENLQRNTVGRVDAENPISFSLSLSGSGRVTLLIGPNVFNTDFIPMPASKAMVFCSTAQFKFTSLVLSAGDPTISLSP